MSSAAAKRESTRARGATPRPTSTSTTAPNVQASRNVGPSFKPGGNGAVARPQKSEKYIRSTERPVSAEATTTANPMTGKTSTAPFTSNSSPTKPSVPGKPVQASAMDRKLTASNGMRS